MKVIDARGLDCPLPIVKTKEVLKDENAVKTIVDNQVAVENLEKFAKVKGYEIEVNQKDLDFEVLVYQGDKPIESYEITDNTVVVISSNQLGSEEKLGKILMKSFLFALTKQDKIPGSIIFYNEGVLITTRESVMLEDLRTLESMGVEIVSCGTCLDYFGKKEELKVGSMTNMYYIVERMENADKLIQPC